MSNKSSPGLNYNQTALRLLSQMTQSTGKINQEELRHLIALAPSFLVLDTTVSPTIGDGINEWSLGLTRLCDVIVALHKKDELQIETLNEASRACSESWSISGSWRGMESVRPAVSAIAMKLKNGVLDPDGLSYKGEAVYVP